LNPSDLPDAELVKAYLLTDGEGEDAEALLAEIERRGLDL